MQENQQTQIELLKRDYSQITGLFGRLDTAIEKLTDVSSSIERMLAIHDLRLNQQDQTIRLMETNIQNLNNERSKVIDIVNDKITGANESVRTSVMALDKSHLSFDKRLNALEQWKYYVLGATVVFVWILNKIPVHNLITPFIAIK